ncbi:MAG: cyclic nucleotide-binding domain-containing protein, partial [Devosia sp.]|nr:cyclic nucleotide-binding domain-containing protein [Devosia sp.]
NKRGSTISLSPDPSSKAATATAGGPSYLEDPITGEREIARLGPGNYVGEVALLQDTPRTATVTAVTRAVVLSITKENFQKFFEAAPEAIADFEVKLARYDVRLRSVLYHPVGLQFFIQHLKREYCLAGDTPVRCFDGRAIPARHVQPGQRLLGTDGRPAVVAKVRHQQSRAMWTVRGGGGTKGGGRPGLGDDEYEVTEAHRLTLRWNQDPLVKLRRSGGDGGGGMSPPQLVVRYFDALYHRPRTHVWPIELVADQPREEEEEVWETLEEAALDYDTASVLSHALPLPSTLLALTRLPLLCGTTREILAFGRAFLAAIDSDDATTEAVSSRPPHPHPAARSRRGGPIVLRAGDLFELTPVELAQRWSDFRLDQPETGRALVTGRLAPMPSRLPVKEGQLRQHQLDDEEGGVRWQHYSTSAASSSSSSSDIVYTMHASLSAATPTSSLTPSTSHFTTFLDLHQAHVHLGLLGKDAHASTAATTAAGTVAGIDEIRTVVLDSDEEAPPTKWSFSPATQQAYSDYCVQSLHALLTRAGRRPPRCIVAFGAETRKHWLELAQRLDSTTTVTTTATCDGRPLPVVAPVPTGADADADEFESLLLPSHPGTTILLFAGSPADWSRSRALLRVLASAHGLDAPSASSVPLEADPLVSLTPSSRAGASSSTEVVHIEISTSPAHAHAHDGSRGDQRFTLASSRLTHNSVENIDFWKECRDFRHLSYADVPKEAEQQAREQAEMEQEIEADIRQLMAAQQQQQAASHDGTTPTSSPAVSPRARRQSLVRIQGLDVAAAFDLFVDAAVVAPASSGVGRSTTEEYMSVASLTEMLRFFHIPLPADSSVLAEMASQLGYDPTSDCPRIERATFVRVLVDCENGKFVEARKRRTLDFQLVQLSEKWENAEAVEEKADWPTSSGAGDNGANGVGGSSSTADPTSDYVRTTGRKSVIMATADAVAMSAAAAASPTSSQAPSLSLASKLLVKLTRTILDLRVAKLKSTFNLYDTDCSGSVRNCDRQAAAARRVPCLADGSR